MDNVRVGVIENLKTNKLVHYLALLSLLVFLPFFLHVQWVTGPVVNAVLIIILFIVGKREALAACLIPSIIALTAGLLPLALSPMIPFIIIGNLAYVLIIDIVYNRFIDQTKGYWIGVISAALIKFLLIFAAFALLSGILLKGKLAMVVAQMMSWAQLATALSGGMIAWLILKWLKRF